MKKLAFVGAVSAFALLGGMAFAAELEVGLDKNVVPVVTGDGSTAVGVSNALNGNKLLSDNKVDTDLFSHNITSVWAPYDDSTNVRVSVGDVLVNNADIKQVVPGASVGVFSTPYPVVGVESQGQWNDHGDENSPTLSVPVYTGAISGNAVAGGNGIFGIGLNTGISNQAAVSQINIGHVNAR